MRFGKKIWTFVLICVLLCASVFPASASDTQLIDTERICDLTIRYFYTDLPVAGAQFSVYRIGDISEDGTHSLIGHFAEYPVDTSHLTEGVLSKTAELLYSYALWDQVEPDAVMTIREDGTAVEQLPVGLYLVAGQKFLDAVTPDHGVISVGEGNTHSHPVPSILERYEKSGITIYRTDKEGSIVFKSTGGEPIKQ